MSHEVLILSPKFRLRSDWAREFLESRGCHLSTKEVTLPMTEDHLCELVEGVAGVITWLEPYTARVLASADRLKVISAGGVGYDHIDVDEATRRGIAVCICAGVNNYAVSELAFGMMIGLSRQIYPADRELRRGNWERYMGPELWGKTLGIIGLGRVGKSVALLAKAFNMRILATDPVWDITFANEHGISYVPFERLMQESDYVSLHAPLLPETYHLIDERSLAMMKPTAFLINTSRGPVVKESALVSALQSGQIAGAGIDVFDPEPHQCDLYADLDNVILTPHIGGSTHEASERGLLLALTNVTAVLNGQPPHCQVNDTTPARWS